MAEASCDLHGILGELDQRREIIRDLIKDKLAKSDNILKKKATKTGYEGRLEKTDEELQELIEFGDELVGNLKVASEIREVQRKTFEDEKKSILMKNVNKESKLAIAKYNNILDKWTELHTYNEPVVLNNQMEKQRERIAEIMASKDDIIDKCQKELERLNVQYYLDQQKQANDVTCMVQRIDSQIELIKDAHKKHLVLLQDSIEEERLKFRQSENEKWADIFEIMRTDEDRKIALEKEKEKFYAKELEKLYREQEEITRAVRIRLERDAEALQLELRNTQNNVLMNSEKVDYNYQVLQRRNEENIIINNQQKRRVGRFKEIISALKTKIAAKKEKTNFAEKKMSEDVKKLYANISELEKKSQQFLRANEKKYRYVFNISYEEVLNLTNRIFEIDRVLYEQQLGVDWIPQYVKGITYDPVEHKTVGRPLLNLDVKASDEESEEKPNNKDNENSKTYAEQLAETRLLRNIFKKIADRGGVLIDSKLGEILKPYTTQEQCLVRVDNIFEALRITDCDDIVALSHYFLPYAWCPNCSDGKFEGVITQLTEKVGYVHGARRKSSLAEELQKIANKDAESVSSFSDVCSISSDEVEKGVDDVLTRTNDIKDDECVAENVCENHYLVIKSAFVLTALRNFIERNIEYRRGSGLGSFERAILKSAKVAHPQSKESVAKFWSNFLQIMPPEKQKLWDTLHHGLDHYLTVLKEREHLDYECEFLRQQNRELRHLLQKLLPSAAEQA